MRADGFIKQQIGSARFHLHVIADMRAHMQAAHVFAIGDDLFASAEPPQHGARQRHAGVLVPIRMPFAVFAPRGGDRFAQVMGQRRINKGFRLFRLRLFLRGRMQHQHAVDIGVALRMITRWLRHIDERRQLAEPRFERARLTKHVKKHVRRIACHRLFHLAQHTRGRQIVRFHRPHPGKRFFIRRQMKP